MSVDRREFLKIGGIAAAGSVAGSLLPAVTGLAALDAGGNVSRASGDHQWGMVIDVDKCTKGCDACADACRTENNVPLFGDPKRDIHWIRTITVKQRGVEDAEERQFPAMCYHCENPPCQHVCPVAATFTRADGIVLIDKHRCIGCRYCMVACPYKARSFVSQHVAHTWDDNKDVPRRMHGVVEKCTLCVHRIDKGEEPACVVACREKGGDAMSFGDLNDPASAVAAAVRSGKATRIRADLGTNPRVFYLGL
ncbi:MAG: 4Fe-4S dicluster domain-containing protein [Nitrospinae bacterium]|nr:4Fe-4S dicluster domain-containing protein [Nitrospinota bacterium]